MLHFNRAQRAVLVDKMADAANIALGGLLFGQALGGNGRSGWFALGGILSWLALLGLSVWLARKD